eukprot:GGOE01018636.1.p3 GENE.GGOE01018636.1~~GGOE01018636.1.p3  ORF type:complete len:144 (+),score=32.02 GGOE01018636.1:3-434(+)
MHHYRIVGLAPSASYEIKVSYPATMPATFEVLWGAAQSQTSRRLLNTHKEIFATDGHGQVKVEGQLGTTEFMLLALRESHSYDIAREQREAILYNIVVAPVLFGVPTEAYPLILVGLLCVAVVWYLTPAAMRLIRGDQKAARA